MDRARTGSDSYPNPSTGIPVCAGCCTLRSDRQRLRRFLIPRVQPGEFLAKLSAGRVSFDPCVTAAELSQCARRRRKLTPACTGRAIRRRFERCFVTISSLRFVWFHRVIQWPERERIGFTGVAQRENECGGVARNRRGAREFQCCKFRRWIACRLRVGNELREWDVAAIQRNCGFWEQHSHGRTRRIAGPILGGIYSATRATGACTTAGTDPSAEPL